jgi:hypothetical protein
LLGKSSTIELGPQSFLNLFCFGAEYH